VEENSEVTLLSYFSYFINNFIARQVDGGFLQSRPGFRPVNVGLVVVKQALEQIFCHWP
jgi:hypothetical protein